MIKLPQLDKRNWKKVLRELDIAQFPSLSDSLKELRKKLLDKTPLGFTDEQLGYARLFNYFEQYQKEINSLYIQTIDWSKFDVRPPLAHQKPAVVFLLEKNRCILGDDMGLGKSMSTIYASSAMEDKHKVLIVTLKTLKYNFAKEVGYLDDRHTVVNKKWEENKFTIVNYESLKKFEAEIIKAKFNIMIFDEAHMIRNNKAQRTKSATNIINKSNPLKVWLLTGTPVSNRPSDYYNLLKLIKHPIAKNWVKYVQRYCDGYVDEWGHWQTKGSSNLDELYRLTQDVFLRRLKTNAGIELPNKTRRPIFFELDNRKGYNNISKEYLDEKRVELSEEFSMDLSAFNNLSMEKMTLMMLQRQFCAIEKLNDGTLFSMVDNFLDESPDNKIIVFTNFRKVVDDVYNHYGPEICSFIDGRITDAKKRLQIVDDFNADPTKRIIVLNMKAGGTGLNIQGANKIIVNDMDFIPSTMIQAEDRAYRIGQKRDVEVVYLVYDKTVESVVYNIIEQKMVIISTIVEGNKEQYFGSENESAIDMSVDEKKRLMEEIFAQLGL